MAYRPAPGIDNFFLEMVTHLCHVQIFKRSANTPEQSRPSSTLIRLNSSPWQKQLTDCLSKFDLLYDLGGLAFAKAWGLATLGDYTAVCVTFHPGDMVEYTINSAERATIIFGRQELLENGLSHVSHVPWAVGELHPRDANMVHSEIVSSVLGFTRKGLGKLCKKMVYAAACVGVLSFTLDRSMIALCGAAFRWLALDNNADLIEELSIYTELQKHHAVHSDVDSGEAAKPTIAARSKAVFESGQIQSILEVCEICGEGIGWYSIQEARCAAGHSFGMESSYLRSQ